MMIDKGHFRAVIDESDLDDVQVSISMCCALDTCEAMLPENETQLEQELHELRMMIHDYVNYLYALREGGLACAV